MSEFQVDPATSKFFKTYEKEILRWNTHISLVSRRDPARVTANLLSQCCDGFRLFWSWYRDSFRSPGNGRLFYSDLGSGAGLPGVVWNQLLFQEGARPSSLLVEPREKRAWFLNRVSLLGGSRPFRVLRARWGEVSALESELGLIEEAVVTLKALHLNEIEVIDGLFDCFDLSPGSAAGLRRVVVVRFYPPQQEMDARLVSSLKLPELGPVTHFCNSSLVFDGCHIIGPTLGLLPASLVVTQYHRADG